jgi:hypothetical protein
MTTMTTDAKACFEACCAAARQCLEASAMCADAGRTAQCKALSDCADVCEAAAACLARCSDCCPSLCAACAEFCSQCAKVCRTLNDPKLAACIEACRACAACCEKVCQAASGRAAAKA